MAASVEARVLMSAEDAEAESEGSSDQRDSDGGSDGASDDGENDGDSGGGSEGEDGGQDEGDEGDGNANAGWAEAMAKILGKKAPDSKSVILVKNKELDKIRDQEREEYLERKRQVDKKRAWEMMCREKPDVVKDREAERALQRIATRGVVQLFNAVRKHQKVIDDQVKEVGGSERKKAKLLSSVSKKDFIDVLRGAEGGGRGGGGRGAANADKELQAAAAEEKPAWSVLRDDFMMGATMKDWDKDSDGEEPGARSAGGPQDSDSD